MREAEMREAGAVQEIRGGGDRKGEREREVRELEGGGGDLAKKTKRATGQREHI